MISNEQKAHDLAVAVALCVEQTKQNIALKANADVRNFSIDIDSDSMLTVYNAAYDEILKKLES